MTIVKGNGATSGNKIQDASKATKVAVADTANRIEFTTNSTLQGYINNQGDIVFGNATSGVPGIELARGSTSAAFGLKLKNTSTGDVRIGLALDSQSYAIGIDNSDSDKLKISTNEDDVGSSTLLTLDSTGKLGLGVSSPLTRLHISGGVTIEPTSISSNTTLDETHSVVDVNATSGNIVLTLPSASGISGRQYIITKSDASANTVTIDADGTETINGELNVVLNDQFDYITIRSNGTNWFTQSSNNISGSKIGLENGSAGSPSLYFNSDPDSGVYSVGANQVGISTNGVNRLTVGDSTFTYNSNTIWHAGNDGSGSGLDADTLDGLNSSDFQTSDAGLSSIAGLTTSANQMIYTTASDTYATTSLTSFSRTLLDDADAATMRSTLGVLGVSDKAADSELLDGIDSTQFLRSDESDTLTGTLTIASGVIANTSGSTASPSYSFSDDLNAGMSRSGAGQLSLSTSGTERVRINSGGIGVNNGSASSPTFNFISNSNLGIYRVGVNQLGVSTGGTLRLTVESTGMTINSGVISNTLGTSALPSYTFTGDLDTGIYSPTSNQIGFSVAGVDAFRITTGQVGGASGTASAPGFSFLNDTNTGIYRVGEDQLGIATNGSFRLSITPTGNITVGTGTEYALGGTTPRLQIHGTSADTSTLGITRWGENANPSYLMLGKSRGASIGTFGLVQNNDIISRILFVADNGSNLTSDAGVIECLMDGTPSSTSTPGVIRFKTTPAGSTSGNIRLTINSIGQSLFTTANTASTPAISFISDPDTGIYSSAANQLSISTGGSRRVLIQDTGIFLLAGSAASPSYGFTNDLDTGIYSSGTNELSISTGGSRRLLVADTGLYTVSGTAALPSYSFTSDGDTGMYLISADDLGFSTGGVQRLRINTLTQLFTNLQIEHANPSLILKDNNSTGASQVGFISLQDSTSTETGYIGFGSSVNTDLTIDNNIGDIVVTIGSTQMLRINSSQAQFLGGSDTVPGISFLGDPDTGIFQYSGSPNTLGISTGGVERVYIDQFGATFFNEYILAYQEIYTNVGFISNVGGSASNTVFTKDGDLNTGMYFPGVDQLGFSAGGTLTLQVTNDGIITEKLKTQDDTVAHNLVIKAGDFTGTGNFNGSAITVTSGTGERAGRSGDITIATANGNSSASFQGARSGVFYIKSGNGGSYTGGAATTGTGGSGGNSSSIIITGGFGGNTNSTGDSFAGNGAEVIIGSGGGGNATAGTGNGGNGGNLTITAGSGGTSAGGTPGTDGIISIQTNSVERIQVNNNGLSITSGHLKRTVTSNITASTTQTQGNGALTSDINHISTVANTNDTVTLPNAEAGMEIMIFNRGANTLRIFPASGDDLGAGVDTSSTLAANGNVRYVSYDATNWISF